MRADPEFKFPQMGKSKKKYILYCLSSSSYNQVDAVTAILIWTNSPQRLVLMMLRWEIWTILGFHSGRYWKKEFKLSGNSYLYPNIVKGSYWLNIREHSMSKNLLARFLLRFAK